MKKKRFQWKSLALLLAAVTALGGLYYYGVFARKKESSDVYSVILYQNTEDEWGNSYSGNHAGRRRSERRCKLYLSFRK